jgi:aerobic carbon-monoxide dehydrogenase small subunit
MNTSLLDLRVNGEAHRIPIEQHWSLLQVLRGPLGLTGTKENCIEAECGVCTVLLDGKAVNSCILLAEQCRGREVTTIEGLGDPEHLHVLQRAFIAFGAVQCGYCIPGMILTAKSFLDSCKGRLPTEPEIREAMAGTLCRCTGYQKIVDAVAAAAREMLPQAQEGKAAAKVAAAAGQTS